MVVTVRTKSQITLPSIIVKKQNINEGDEFEVVEREDGGILLVPVVTYPKAYVEELEKEAKETMARVKEGKWPTFKNVDAMIDYLEKK